MSRTLRASLLVLVALCARAQKMSLGEIQIPAGDIIQLPMGSPSIGQVLAVGAIPFAGFDQLAWVNNGSDTCVAGGADTQIIYNKSGTCAGDANLVWLYNSYSLNVSAPGPNTTVIHKLIGYVNTGGIASKLIFQASQGSRGAESAIQNTTILGQQEYWGWNGSTWYASALIAGMATENWTGSHGGSTLVFAATANGTVTATSYWQLGNDGTLQPFSNGAGVPTYNLGGPSGQNVISTEYVATINVGLASGQDTIIQNSKIDASALLSGGFTIHGANNSDGRIILTPGNVAVSAGSNRSSVYTQQQIQSQPALIAQDYSTGGTNSIFAVEDQSGNQIFSVQGGGTATPYAVTSRNHYPHANNTDDLGSSSFYWNNAYINNLHVNSCTACSFANQQLSNLSGTVAINLSLTPNADDSLLIGSTSKAWFKGYAYRWEAYTIGIDNPADGAFSAAWTITNPSDHNLYFSDGAYVALDINNEQVSGLPTIFNFQGLIQPLTDQGFDIGQTSIRWRNVYAMGGHFYSGLTLDGSNTITIGSGNFYARNYASGAISCSGVGNGWLGYATTPNWLQVCDASAVVNFYGITANTTGAKSATLGTNGPMVTTTPYTWLQMISNDGSTVYVPAWK